MCSLLSGISILAVALWVLLLESANGQSQYRMTLARSGRPMKPVVLKSAPECPMPYFPNGVAKARQRNKMVRYTCSSGFYLVGNIYSMCEKGRWDTPVPICIKSGCADMELVENGQLSYEYGKAALMLFCNTGYQIAGSAKTYCNGTHWDRPLGTCRENGLAVQTSCDFEVDDLCGWMNEATHDFDWRRSDGILSPKALKTGPKFDHTTMVPLAGHFMMVDSAAQLTNETARILSPIYPANYSRNACFQFYYHMFGDKVGYLMVHVKPASQSLDSLSSSDAYFVKNSNHGNMWVQGYFDIREQSESFQIVIEASIGMKFRSDIAIDDVSLMNGANCQSTEKQDEVAEETSSVVPDEIPVDVPVDKEVFKIDSCENRCGKSVESVVELGDRNVIHCDCVEGCVDTRTCCPDYAERCVFNVTGEAVSNVTTTSSTVATTSTTASSTTSTSTTTTMKPTTSTTTTVKPTSNTTTVKLTTSTTTQRPTTSTTTQKPTTSTTTQKSSTNTTTQKPTISTTTTTTTQRPTSRSTKPSTTTHLPTPLITNTTSARPYNLRPRTTTEATVIVPFVRTRKPTKPTMTTSTLPPPVPVEEVTMRVVSRFGNVPELPAAIVDNTKPNLAQVFLFTGIGVVGFASVVSLIVLHVRRNSGVNVLNRLKQKSLKKGYDGSEGFEDVRFLAVDEHLDFSLPDDDNGEGAGECDREEGKKDQQKGNRRGKK